jgi:hypothetical protein
MSAPSGRSSSDVEYVACDAAAIALVGGHDADLRDVVPADTFHAAVAQFIRSGARPRVLGPFAIDRFAAAPWLRRPDRIGGSSEVLTQW